MNHPEQSLQTHVATYLGWALSEPWYWTAIGHGGGGHLRGMILKGMGVKKGIYDFLFLGPDRFVGWIELKSLAGTLTPEQRAFQEMVLKFGHHTAVAKSLDEVRLILLSWNAPLRETKRSVEGIINVESYDLRIAPTPSGSWDFPDSGPLVRRKGAK